MKIGPIIVGGVVLLALAGGLIWRLNSGPGNNAGSRAEAGSSGVKLDRPISVGVVTWGGYAGGIMENNGFKPNKNCDFYRNHDIQVELKVIDDFVQSRSAFKAGGDKGGVDIVWGTVDAYALEYPGLKDLNPVCIMQYDWSRGGDAIAVDGAVIRSAADLKGKTIAVAEETPSHYFALFVLTEAGLIPSDVQWRFTNSAIDAANVFKAGKTDACVSWSPDVYIAARERKNGKILMSTREATNLIADIFIARGDFVQKHPDAVKAFVYGWLEGVDKVHQNPKAVVKLMADGFNLKMDDAEAMLGDVHLPNYSDNMHFFDNSNPTSYDAIFNKASKLWTDLGKLPAAAQAKETRDTKYLLDLGDKFGEQKPADPLVDVNYKPAVTAKGTNDVITKRVTINFASGVSEMDPESKTVVRNNVAQFVATYSGCVASIEGNTDNVGNFNYNMTLSKQRAESVRDFLLAEFKMAPGRFLVKGNGPKNPIASNNSEEGKAKNRRTDIVIKSVAE